MRKALPILVVFAVAGFLLLAHVGAPPLDEAEARSAIVSRHILSTGQWLWPVPAGPFTCERSPLAYWQALPFAWLSGGMTELAVRLPSVLWALALLFFTWDLARRWHDGLAALLSVGALATSYGFVHWGRHGTSEVAQAATLLWCLWYFAKHRADSSRRWLLIFGALVGLGANFGAREAYGVVVIGVLILAAMAKDWAWLRPARTVALAGALSLAVFLALPLAATIEAESVEPFRALWREHVMRHLVPLHQAFGWHKDLWRLVLFCLPWLVLVPIAAAHELWRWRCRQVGTSVAVPLAGVTLIWLALSSPREPRHVLAIVPFTAITVGRLLAQFARGELPGVATVAVRSVAGCAGLLLLGPITGILNPAFAWRGWQAALVMAAAGLVLLFGAVARQSRVLVGATAALWLAYVVGPLPREDGLSAQVGLIARRGKPVAFLGAVPAPVAFYLNAGYAVFDDPAEAHKWAAETGGTVIASGKPHSGTWDLVAEGQSWRALAWNPQARALSLTRDPAWLAKHPLRGIKSETLTYEFSAESGIRFNLGTVTMRLAREEGKTGRELVITAESKGGVPGYPTASAITSRLRDSDLAQVEADDLRTKPSYKHRRFTWMPQGVDYHRHDHCKDKSCRNPAHMVSRPDGTRAHCSDKRCKKDEHRVWNLKQAFREPGAADAFHVIAACYIARGFDARLDAPPQLIRVINNQQMWDVAVRAAEEKTIQVPAGKFDCVKVAFDAKPLNKEAKESADEAEGPFGLTGYANIYVDKATGVLVLLDGEMTLGATFKVQVMLTSRQAEPLP